MATLRSKLGKGVQIQTVRGIGYRIVPAGPDADGQTEGER
jgi:DNA-binding response OmpR family regulator